MATSLNYLISSRIFLRAHLSIPFLVNAKRGIRGVTRPIRTRLPRYQKDLKSLPVLTELLTSPEEVNDLSDAIKIRLGKLDIYKQYLPVNTNTNLIEAIFHRDNDIDRLLRVIDENLETMTSFYLAVSFEALDDMMRAQLCETSTVAVSPEFRRLCTKTLYKIRFFEADEIIKLLKSLSTLQMPEDTLLVQAGLQMARHLINDFDHSELECLSQVLATFEVKEDPGKSLLLALREAAELRLASTRRLEPGALPADNKES